MVFIMPVYISKYYKQKSKVVCQGKNQIFLLSCTGEDRCESLKRKEKFYYQDVPFLKSAHRVEGSKCLPLFQFFGQNLSSRSFTNRGRYDLMIVIRICSMFIWGCEQRKSLKWNTNVFHWMKRGYQSNPLCQFSYPWPWKAAIFSLKLLLYYCWCVHLWVEEELV